MFELQPLRIQAGWSIDYNNFTEYDAKTQGEHCSYELNEDLLQISSVKGNLIIDLGWYPDGDVNGSYLLLLVKDCDWGFPLEKLKTQEKQAVIDSIEKWVCYGFYSKFL